MNYFAIATKHDGSFEFIEKSKEELTIIMNKMSNEGSENYKEIRVFSYSKYTTKRVFKTKKEFQDLAKAKAKAEAELKALAEEESAAKVETEVKPKPQAKSKNG